MTKTPYPATPQLDKLIALKGANHIVGFFLDWLQAAGLGICEYDEQWVSVHLSTQDLIAMHFGIDRKAMDAEQEAVLDWHRKSTGLA
jgi:hypothetical protein